MIDHSMKKILILPLLFSFFLTQAQVNPNKFQPMTWEFPTANESRLASGAPGPAYWQQQVDYKMALTLEEGTQMVRGEETITYHNRSPHTLTYLWVQLDQNLFAPNSLHFKMMEGSETLMPTLMDMQARPGLQAPGCNIDFVKMNGTSLSYTIVETNMRINLPVPLQPGGKINFEIGWNYRINDALIEGRCGHEYFPDDKNFIFELAQFYPRLCVYDNVKGWQNMPYTGAAEFALEFGNFEVAVTAPADFVVAATGVLQNEAEVLTAVQLERLAKIRSENEILSAVITTEEATANEKSRSTETKTWKFAAENVRDFAIAASRKFAWDAASVKVGNKSVLAMSYYPKEASPLWNKYATHAIMTTLKVYSRYSVDYPYPVAIAVNGPVWGMEYPMICFCGGRPESSGGSYSSQTKYSTISVIIHEVGHNFFPMIINSDERNWAWMDEGFNSFFQYLTETEFEPNYPHRRGNPSGMANFLAGPNVNPIMTNPESMIANGSTTYGKTAAGLYLLREKIMGHKVFDMAFREYAQRWAFKHPEPADFFRTMKDASGVNLDWFWRAWFYGTEPYDANLQSVSWLKESTRSFETPFEKESHPSDQVFYVDGKPELVDAMTQTEVTIFEPYEYIRNKAMDIKKESMGTFIYTVVIENDGGCPLPVTLTAIMAGGEVRHYPLPAEIWIKNNADFITEIRSFSNVVAFSLDYHQEWPDYDRGNDAKVLVAEKSPEDAPEGPNHKKKK
jgi:Peptidase family M1 domain